MSYINLYSFVDRSNLLAPVGLVTSDGLTSAMRNPLYPDYANQITVDYRPRDNGYLIGYENMRVPYDSYVVQNGNSSPTYNITVDGIRPTTEYVGGNVECLLPNPTDSVRFSHSANSNVVVVGAFKITEILNDNGNWGFFGFHGTHSLSCSIAYSQGVNQRLGVYVNPIIGFKNFIDASSDNITAASVGEWVFVFLSKWRDDPTTYVSARIAGGQFGATPVGSQNSAVGVEPVNFDRACIHAILNTRCAFQTFAVYSGNNDAGERGVDYNGLDWSIFDAQHQCNSYVISGNRLTFECTGEVAWEIKVGGTWKNTDGTTGSGDRVFYTTGEHTVSTANFTEIRPILKNSGVLNADTVSVLNWVNVDSYDTTPSVSILTPSQTIALGATVTLEGVATDTQQGNISEFIIWSSSIDGTLGSGSSLVVSLSGGVHTITATIEDSAHIVISDSIQITCVAPPERRIIVDATEFYVTVFSPRRRVDPE